MQAALATIGFIAVGCMLGTNNFIARANAGEVPPFALAFMRWALVALCLAPFVADEMRAHWSAIRSRLVMVALTGFCGMFLCGGPVYLAGVTTSAINIGLIMTATPIIVLLVSWCLSLEKIKPVQVLSIVVALPGVLLILARGSFEMLTTVDFVRGDLIALVATLGWTGYNLLQVRALPDMSFIARTCLYAGAGAVWTLPLFLREAVDTPQAVLSMRALYTYAFVAIVPGIGAYAGLAFLAGRFGAVRASLITYVSPIATVLLSTVFLREGLSIYHSIGGGLILTGVWLSMRGGARQ